MQWSGVLAYKATDFDDFKITGDRNCSKFICFKNCDELKNTPIATFFAEIFFLGLKVVEKRAQTF